MAEYDTKSQIFYGLVVISRYLGISIWGRFRLKDLCDLKIKYLVRAKPFEASKDVSFKPKKAGEIKAVSMVEGFSPTDLKLHITEPEKS